MGGLFSGAGGVDARTGSQGDFRVFCLPRNRQGDGRIVKNLDKLLSIYLLPH
jgi:hypothetical protein